MGTTIKQKIGALGAIGIITLGTLFNSGCASPKTRLEGYRKDVIEFEKKGLDKLFFCVGEFSKDSDPNNQEYLDRRCKECIRNNGEIPTDNFREQGEKLYYIKMTPMTNLYYDGQFLYFSKKWYPDRFAVKVDTLTTYEYMGGNEWKYSECMTRWARTGRDVYAAIDQMKAQPNANNTNNNQRERNSKIMDGIKERVGADLATMGLLEALSEK